MAKKKITKESLAIEALREIAIASYWEGKLNTCTTNGRTEEACKICQHNNFCSKMDKLDKILGLSY